MTDPKLFISYSWSNPDHEAFVLRLATELCENRVDVILDKWDLREGQASTTFMETMVNDPEIGKVLLVCDRIYVEKANERSGGVGTEAQIISPEIYASQTQSKFVALVLERDEAGAPLVPHYYKSRIHIDFSDPSNHATAFEQILRWTYDKPLHEKPPLGSRPSFLDQTNGVPLMAVASRHRQALQAIQDGRTNANSCIIEYLDNFASELEKLRLKNVSVDFDDAVVSSVESAIPYRNQLVQVFDALALHRPGPESVRLLHRFFERILPYSERPSSITSWREMDFDNFKFIIHELFLYAVATLLRHDRFAELSQLLDSEYYWPDRSDGRASDVVSYLEFFQYLTSLEVRKSRLKLPRLSLHADMLKDRCTELPVSFAQLTQADFVLFIRSTVAAGENWGGWWPVTLVFCCRFPSRFEIFARARSASYLTNLLPVLGVSALEQLKSAVIALKKDSRRLPRWDFESLDPSRLMAIDELATRP